MKRTLDGKNYVNGIKRTLEITDLSAKYNISDECDNLVRLTILNSRGGIESTMVCDKLELRDIVLKLR